MFAEILLSKNFSRSFTYRIPSELQKELHIGSWVIVPFGRTLQLALVTKIFNSDPPILPNRGKPIELKNIIQLASPETTPPIDSHLLGLAHDLSEYYMAPFGLTLRLILPPPKVQSGVGRRWMLTAKGQQAQPTSKTLSPAASAILARLSTTKKGLTTATLKKYIQEIDQGLHQLKRRGWVEEQFRITPQKPGYPSAPPVRPDRQKHPQPCASPDKQVPQTSLFAPSVLTPVANFSPGDKSSWYQQFRETLEQGTFQEILLWTSPSQMLKSLFLTIQDTINLHRSVVILSPNLERATLIAQSVGARWNDLVSLYHGGQPTSHKAQLWNELRQGTRKIIIGTRTALFLPIPSLGLIGLDQEEHTLFKDEHIPYYHTREAARMLARRHQAVLLHGTSNPSMETFYAQYGDSALPPTIEGTNEISLQTPDIQLISLNQTPSSSSISSPMRDGIQLTLAEGGQAIIFLNRKGYSRSLPCKACGHIPACPRCHIPFTVHKIPPQFSCSYCGKTESLPTTCPKCFDTRLEPVGVGTERMEEMVRKEFPNTTIQRVDGDTIRTLQQAFTIQKRFREGDIQILVGTQMMFQGYWSHQVKFVGIPYADAGLHFPDFRSAERVYHQLNQAVGMAKPQHEGGRVLIQTYLATHHVIQAIAEQSPLMFYSHELQFRQALGYPPYSHLLLLHITGSAPKTVESAAQQWAAQILFQLSSSQPSPPSLHNPLNLNEGVLGPVPVSPAQAKGKCRFKILVKAKDLYSIREIIRTTRQKVQAERRNKDIQFSVNVDPGEVV
jgi:primosomal protein N' (replication factor Y)